MGKESVACIISFGTKVLLGKRLPCGDMGSRWEFPGGKVEPNESHGQAVEREIFEEFGVSAHVKNFICDTVFENHEHTFHLFAYEVFVSNDIADFCLAEHSKVDWFDVEEIPSLDFVDSDMQLYPAVKKYLLERTNG